MVLMLQTYPQLFSFLFLLFFFLLYGAQTWEGLSVDALKGNLLI